MQLTERHASSLLRNVDVLFSESVLKAQKTDEDLGLGADGEHARKHTLHTRTHI